MIEISAGVLLIFAALLVGMGLAGDVVPSSFSMSTAALTAMLGIVLLGYGLYRRALARRGLDRRHWLRLFGLSMAMLFLAALFALLVPLLAPMLNGLRLSGLPLGFYMVAQGGLLALVVILFLYARRAEAIDREDGG